MGTTIGISSLELEDDEKTVQESATVCNIEFEKQEDFFQTIIGTRIKGRSVAKPFLTNKRLIIWLLLVPETGEPKNTWYSFPLDGINYMRPNKSGMHGAGQKGLEVEFAAPKVGGIGADLAKKMQEGRGIIGWLGNRMSLERIKLWLYLPDNPSWYLAITNLLGKKNLQEKVTN